MNITEGDRKEIQGEFEKEMTFSCINSQDEFDIDYVIWLESMVCDLRRELADALDASESYKEQLKDYCK